MQKKFLELKKQFIKFIKKLLLFLLFVSICIVLIIHYSGYKIITNLDDISNSTNIEIKELFKSKPILQKKFYDNGNIKSELIDNYFLNKTMYRDWYETGLIKSFYYSSNEDISDQKITFYENGLIKKVQTLINDIADGIEVEYFKNGMIKSKGYYSNNTKNGDWIYYFKNGMIKSKGYYSNNTKNGYWISYYKNGQLMLAGDYKDGSPDGTWIVYDSLDNLILNLEYSSSGCIGSEYNKNGHIIAKGHLENKSISIANNLLEYDNALKSLHKQSTVSNVFESLGFYKYGKWMYWYDSGKVNSVLYYSDGELNGAATYYDSDGSISKTINYYKGIDENKIHKVSAERLYEFSNIFDGQIVEVTGHFQEYNESIYGVPFITVGKWESNKLVPYIMDGRGSKRIGIVKGPTCYFGNSSKNELKKLRPQVSKVTIRGKCSKGFGGLVTLRECELISHELDVYYRY